MNVKFKNVWREDSLLVLLPAVVWDRSTEELCFGWLLWVVSIEYGA